MAKILLVEDDNNLREIYEARLVAEGYEIVSARDGEEALSVAMKEKPDLVISDVMMPKISGFDMLDILRTTEETKHVKIIMMTALSQAEDKERAEKLGADRYLVKSQVTLEDVAKVAKEVLEGKPDPSATPEPIAVPPEPVATAPAPEAVPAPEPVEKEIESEEKAIAQQLEGMMAAPAPVAPAPEPVAAPVAPAPVAAPAADPIPVVAAPPEPTPAPAPAAAVPEPVVAPVAPAPTDDTTVATPPAEPPTTAVETPKKKVIEPINDLSVDAKPKLDELLAKEEEKEQMSGIAAAVAQHPGATTPGKDTSTPGQAVTGSETPITPPNPDTKVDPSTIAL